MRNACAILIVLAAAARAAEPVPAPVGGSESFLADCRALTRSAHRLGGSDEARAAAQYIAGRLEEIGVDRVILQPFQTAQLVGKRCALRVEEPGPDGEKSLRLFPMRPNGILPPVTPPGGIEGALVLGGTGEPGGFGARSPEGRIAVLDYNGRDGWLRAFRLGAKAVVFVRRDPCDSWHSHYVEVNANLPRFYYPGDPADLREGVHATIQSEITWEAARGLNVFGYIRGSAPERSLGTEEILVVAAALDSYGEVPQRSPGARGAANCAALLRMAEHLVRSRPGRNVLVAFLDHEARGHTGSCVFYRALEEDYKTATVEDRMESVRNETRFLERMKRVLDSDDPLDPRHDIRRQLQLRLKEKAADHGDDVRAALAQLRRERAAGAGDAAAGVSELDGRIAEMEKTRDKWNEVRRYLARLAGRPDPAWADPLRKVLDEVREDVAVRSRELALERAEVEACREIGEQIGSQWISLHVSLLFGDSLPRWGLIAGGDSDWHSDKDKPGLYGRIFKAFLTAHRTAVGEGDDLSLFETRSADGTLSPPRLLWAAPYLVHSGEVAGRYGIFNIAFATVQERLPREGTPDDTLESLRAGLVERQADQAARLLRHASLQDGLSLRRPIEIRREYVLTRFRPDDRVAGPAVLARSEGSSFPNKRMGGAIVQLHAGERRELPPTPLKKIYGFDNFQVLRTDRNGSYSYGPVPPDPYGSIVGGFGASFDQRGVAVYASDQATEHQMATRLNLFPCREGAIVIPPRFETAPAQILTARANSPLQADRSLCKTLDGVVHWYCEDRTDAVKVFGIQATVALANGPDRLGGAGGADDPEGSDLSVREAWRFPDASPRAASDLWRLDESRMAILRSRGVGNASVEELHGRAEDLMLESEGASDVVAREALAASSFLLEGRVYERTRSALDDLVRAVLILLALSVPFAFAMERLLIGATTIYKRLLGFVAFFLVTFLVLFFSHPAFAVSATPIIIFLGFAIVVLSVLVIGVIMGKFEVELKVLQGMRSTVHAADVSRLGTVVGRCARP